MRTRIPNLFAAMFIAYLAFACAEIAESPDGSFGADAGMVNDVHPEDLAEWLRNSPPQDEQTTSSELNWADGLFVDAKRWPGGFVEYVISMDECPGESESQFRALVEEGIAHWNRDSRIVIMPWDTSDDVEQAADYAECYSDNDCGLSSTTSDPIVSCPCIKWGGRSFMKFRCNTESKVFPPGWPGAGDYRSVKIRSTATVSTVIHETGHALGFLHEHQREDRGQHVYYFDEAVDGVSDEINFWKCDTFSSCDTVGDYDYDSIMHYNSTARSNGYASLLRRNQWSIGLNGQANNYFTCRSSSSNLPGLGATQVADFDLDGRDDLLSFANGRFSVTYVDTNSPNQVGDLECSDTTLLNNAYMSNAGMGDVAIGQFDNDSRPDVFVTTGTGWWVMRSIDAWAPVFLQASPYRVGTDSLSLGFINSDAYADVVLLAGGKLYVSYSGTSPWVELRELPVFSASCQTPDLCQPLVYDSRVLIGDLTDAPNDDIVVWYTKPSEQHPLPATTEWGMYLGSSNNSLLSIDSPVVPRERSRVLRRGNKDFLHYFGTTSSYLDFGSWPNSGGNWVEILAGTTLPHGSEYFQIGNFGNRSGNGTWTLFGTDQDDVITSGWIPRPTELSVGDIANTETVYGACPDYLKHKYTNCYHPVPIAATVAAIL